MPKVKAVSYNILSNLALSAASTVFRKTSMKLGILFL